MKHKKPNKYRTTALSLILSGILLSSCGAAEPASLVAPKNNERLMEQAQNASDENRKQVSELTGERYTFSYVSADGKVTITADADVTLPEKDSVPMVRVASASFTGEQAMAAFRYLFEGKETWRYPSGASFQKSDADSRVAELESQIESVRSDPDMESEEKNRRIAALEYQIQELRDFYDNLPETIERIPVDGTFFTDTIATVSGEQSYRSLVANTDAGDHLEIQNFGDFGSSGSYLLYYAGQTGGDNPLRKDYYALEKDGISCTCSLTEAEARNQAAGLLDAMGVECALAWSGIACSEFTETGEPLSPDAWAFFFTRVIDGVPVAATTCGLSYHNETAEHWLYEKILICVNDDGIAQIRWEYPTESGEVISEDVAVLPFSAAAERFEQMAPLIWQGNLVELRQTSTDEISYRIEVTSVALHLVRVRDGGGLTGLYTPAWVFYGKETRIAERSGVVFEGTEDQPWILMAINAVDGSIIDLIAGY